MKIRVGIGNKYAMEGSRKELRVQGGWQQMCVIYEDKRRATQYMEEYWHRKLIRTTCSSRMQIREFSCNNLWALLSPRYLKLRDKHTNQNLYQIRYLVKVDVQRVSVYVLRDKHTISQNLYKIRYLVKVDVQRVSVYVLCCGGNHLIYYKCFSINLVN